MEEAKVEAILLGNPIKAKRPAPPLIQTWGMGEEMEEAEEAEEGEILEEAEEGEILEAPEEGEIPQIPMQQE